MTLHTLHWLRALTLVVGSAASSLALATNDHDDARWAGGRYEVTVTNLTRGQQFTPFLVTSHKPRVSLFEPGQPTSPELVALAESGDTGPLAAALSINPRVGSVVTGNGLTNPGATTVVVVQGRGGFGRLSLAAMLIPTNDAFVALDSVPLPRAYNTVTVDVPAYDAGSERNDELCASIPGPNFAECGGSGGGGAPVGGEEGFVHIHSGMHGTGDFKAAQRDWRNPVARITIRRLP